jgi:hypothetical protein
VRAGHALAVFRVSVNARARLFSRAALIGLATVAVMPAAPAFAGRLLVTGHDADLHCAGGGQQCHFVKVALDYVRAGAPNPDAPVLVLDRLDLDLSRALDTPEVGGPGAVPRVVIDPRAELASHPLTTDRYSAIAIASDTSCGGCDLNELFTRAGADTPDSDAINARTPDIQAFFNAGGGIYVNSGAEHANGNAGDGADVFYDFLPLPATGAAVEAPFCLTDAGRSLGFEDTRCPDPSRHSGDGKVQDINCCATHNSFLLPPEGSELRVAEVDGAGLAETLFADGEIRGGELVRAHAAAPAPSHPDTNDRHRARCEIAGPPTAAARRPAAACRRPQGERRRRTGQRARARRAPAPSPLLRPGEPEGSTLDTARAGASDPGPLVPRHRRGAVRLQSARNPRRMQTAVLSRAIFQVLQSRRRRARGLTELRIKGGRFRRCGLSGRRSQASAARPRVRRRVVRRLRARARGRFRTRGRYSAATVRGTTWTTYDRCDGTLTRVRRGKVAVRDFRRRRTVVVRAGNRYLARARR